MVFWLLVSAIGCGQGNPQTTPQSSPITRTTGGGGTVQMDVGADGSRPVGIDALVARFPVLLAAGTNTRKEVTTAMNVVPGPCGVCDGASLAQCAVSHPTDCDVADTIAKRAVVLADAGMIADRLKVALNYPDQWFPRLGNGVPVNVTLFTDPSCPFRTETEAIREELVQRFGDKIRWTIQSAATEPPEPRLGVRSTPTWFVNGHRFRGLQSARSLGRFIGFELITEPDE